ncbi:MAG: DUF6732 family protein [Pseudomonadota bacterium]
MVRLYSIAALTLMPLVASAHPGHIAEAAGHNHWVAGAAIGLAAAITLWAGLKAIKGRRSEASETPETDGSEDGTGSETA